MLQPFYTPESVRVAYQLRYDWFGWPGRGEFQSESQSVLEKVRSEWEKDGLRLLECNWSPSTVKILFSVTPAVDGLFFAGRVKGRLDYELRRLDPNASFNRKVAVRTLGAADRKTTEDYVARQVESRHYVDPRFEEFLKQFSYSSPEVRLDAPSESKHGRYWYNFHLVYEVDGNIKITDETTLRNIYSMCFKVAVAKGHQISRLSVLPEHLHLSLRGNISHSPLDIALAFMNNTAYAAGRPNIWKPGFYIGTIGEYDMMAVRRQNAIQPP